MAVIRDRTSAAARGCWLPLLLFGALICGSLPFYERLSRSRPSLAGLPAAGTAGPRSISPATCRPEWAT